MTEHATIAALRPELEAIANGAAPAAHSDGDSPSTWLPVALADIVTGGQLDDPPAYLQRTDGVRLLYRGKLHALSGEPEAGKGWLVLHATAERLSDGEHVLYIDFEDTPATIVSRLMLLGVTGDAIVAQLHYMRPDEPLDDRGRHALEQALAGGVTLAIIDGVTEALAIHGLDLGDNSDVAKWLTLLPRLLVRAGATVVLLDHVTKDSTARGRYAIGAQHKLAGVDVAYTLEVAEPFGRGRNGLSRLSVKKDRPGHVRQHGDSTGRVAELRLASHTDGTVTATLDAPGDSSAAPFRPTVLMERVSRALEDTPGLSKTAIRDTVRGKSAGIYLALEVLVADGHVRAERDGQAVRHHVNRPYREDNGTDEYPRTQPVPQPVPVPVESDRYPLTLPLRGGQGSGYEAAPPPSTRTRTPEDDA